MSNRQFDKQFAASLRENISNCKFVIKDIKLEFTLGGWIENDALLYKLKEEKFMLTHNNTNT